MVVSADATLADLPTPVARMLREFTDAARAAFGEDLRAIVLYGSAADGKLRATSDVNVLVVLEAFEPAKADRLREPLRVAQAAVRLAAMFLLQAEIGPAVEAFAVKFGDILHRRRVLYGDDPFRGVTVPRPSQVARLKQVLLNLTLRLRAWYMLRSLREEQLAFVIADAAGPLRAAAAALLGLEGQPTPPSPKDALARVAASLPGAGWAEVLARVSEAREMRRLPPGVAGPALVRLIELTERMRERAARLG